ncbi:hypothetical protein G9C98_001254 [Cotesia typhae]|uniref:Amine oxidase domain-containing protein n=1 Tax=Cotesia typhae TaxID=2053667 RepID=A0A8J5USQ7_9HYME|nr:hypothetical protein G9C98_001254 [Cotesia typhae]
MSRVIIIGAGPSGIAAASRLIQNGFDVTIFEAENQIGGRICSFQMGEYMADLGAEWVHGEKDNVAFELAWPLGLLERTYENKEFNSSGIFVGSGGKIISEQVAAPLINEYFRSHPEISTDKHKPLMESLNSAQMIMDGAKNWHEVSAKGSKTTQTKKYPNPKEELPVRSKTKLNSKISRIDYSKSPIKPQRRWMLGLTSSMRIEHRPKMMVFWVTGCYVHEMESIDEKLFQEQVKQVINKFFGKTHKLSEPNIIKRSLWNTNENFLGTQSFRPVKADFVDAHIEDLAAPIEVNNKPTILFAGEATSLHYSTVNGAIESGWREADRLINYYK